MPKSRSLFSKRVTYLVTPCSRAFSGGGFCFFYRLSDRQQVSVRLYFLSSDNKLNLLSICQQQGPPDSYDQKTSKPLKLWLRSEGELNLLLYGSRCLLCLPGHDKWKSGACFDRRWSKESLALLRQGRDSWMVNPQRVVWLYSTRRRGAPFTF